MNGKNDQEWFDRYIKGQLDEEEVKEFEERLKNDDAFNKSFNAFREVIRQLHSNDRKIKLKGRLNQIHNEILLEKSVRREKKFGRTIRLHSVTMIVAASVALIIVFGAIFTINYINSFKTQEDKYISLKREVALIQRSQRAMIDTFNSKSRKEAEENRGKYTGTGFLINKDGYVLTCYHLVKDQDSLALVNEKYGHLKAYLVKFDPNTDVALLRIEDSLFQNPKLMPFTLCDQEALLGEKVYTLGYPKQDIVYNEGSVSSHSGYQGDTTSYQVSIPLNPGNSGGPLINDLGCIVGVVNGKNITEEGAAFALKSGYLKNFLQDPADTVNRVNTFWGRKSLVSKLPRPQQVKSLMDYVFEVKVYEN